MCVCWGVGGEEAKEKKKGQWKPPRHHYTPTTCLKAWSSDSKDKRKTRDEKIGKALYTIHTR